jgi:hypothetical protein
VWVSRLEVLDVMVSRKVGLKEAFLVELGCGSIVGLMLAERERENKGVLLLLLQYYCDVTLVWRRYRSCAFGQSNYSIAFKCQPQLYGSLAFGSN